MRANQQPLSGDWRRDHSQAAGRDGKRGVRPPLAPVNNNL